ncbi:MAG: methyltransferase domain-containing protein [Anaerolineae bacterium]|nr:methyltransferase domain-containing protein [Anaerolineae bacterium]
MFNTLLHRSARPASWQKIPWDEPDFSRRMLAEHLSQAHDAASRRFSLIDQHVAWIQRKLLQAQPARILDLGCGPGFYSKRLTALGHSCTGIDFSPASIAYAREQHPGGNYVLGSILEADYGEGYDLVMLIFGELNAFSAEDAERIVVRAHAALKPGGRLLLEVHRHDFIYRLGHEPASWHTAQGGLFSDAPYLCLTEAFYEDDCAISHYYVYAAEGGAMQQYTTMHRGYTDDEYRRLLGTFQRVLFYPSLTGAVEPADLFVIAAEK